MVTPLVGVWIEMSALFAQETALSVTPLVGVWIEISLLILLTRISQSLPSWECGLKLPLDPAVSLRSQVTPLVGVWIEINIPVLAAVGIFVTPLVGVWIEIPTLG